MLSKSAARLAAKRCSKAPPTGGRGVDDQLHAAGGREEPAGGPAGAL